MRRSLLGKSAFYAYAAHTKQGDDFIGARDAIRNGSSAFESRRAAVVHVGRGDRDVAQVTDHDVEQRPDDVDLGDDSPLPDGLANGDGNRSPHMPFTKSGTAFARNAPPKAQAMY